jgi:hypothetical protein
MLSGTFIILQDSSAQQSNSTNVKNQTKPIDYLLYENSTYGIKISYPKNWSFETIQEESPVTHIVIFYSPESRDYVQLGIDTYDYSNTKIDTLKELLKQSIESHTFYPEYFPDFKLLESSTNKVLAGLPAYMLEGEYQDSQFGKQMVLETGILKDGIHYYMSYIGSPSQYKYYLPIVQTMLKSFEMELENK